MIKAVHNQLRAHDMGTGPRPWMQEEIMQMLLRYPLLGARVNDLALNEEYRQSFSTDSCKTLGHPLRSDQRANGRYKTDISEFPSAGGGTTSMQDHDFQAQY
jgi:hypothetical protein